MKIPIQYALTYPRRKPTPVKRLSLTEYGNLTFLKPDLDTFVCLSSCIDAVIRGGLYPCVVNSANEQAVALFLQQKISYTDIGKCVRYALDHYSCSRDRYTLEDVLFTDQQVREMIKEYCLTP